MRNWSTDTTKFNTKSSEYIIWKLEQLINYGLKGEKISQANLKKFFSFLNLDPDKKKFIKLILGNA